MPGPRILVIEDDATAQRVMKMFLEKSGYEAVLVGTGTKGLEEALKPEAPDLILLDWMLPDMDGPAVCKKLREAKPRVRPYVIFLSAKQEKAEIAAALDSGADDFLGKPFNVAEAQARLRVARRTLDYQRELLKQLEDNEQLSQRNSLLQEMMKHETRHPFGGAAKKEEPKEAEGTPGKLSVQELRFTLSAAFLEAKLALEAVTVDSAGLSLSNGNLLAWAGLGIKRTGHWMDLLLSANVDDARQLFSSSLRREARNEVELLGFLAELARIVGHGHSRAIRARFGETVQPLISKGINIRDRSGKYPMVTEANHYLLTIEGVKLLLMTSVSAGARKAVPTTGLKALDVLAAPFPPETVSSVPMFKEGVVLSARFIDKLSYQIESTAVGSNAEIWRPSNLASYFHQEA